MYVNYISYHADMCERYCFQPMHDNYDLRQEQLNKSSLLSSPKFLERLVEIFIQNVVCRFAFFFFTRHTTNLPCFYHLFVLACIIPLYTCDYFAAYIYDVKLFRYVSFHTFSL